MLKHEFDRQNGILYLTPKDQLEKKDFETLAAEIDPYINENGKINGIMVIASEGFPHWKNFEAMVTHFKFVRDHHQKVKRIAIVSDSVMASVMPAMMKHFVNAQIKHFQSNERNLADVWIKEGSQVRAPLEVE